MCFNFLIDLSKLSIPFETILNKNQAKWKDTKIISQPEFPHHHDFHYGFKLPLKKEKKKKKAKLNVKQ